MSYLTQLFTPEPKAVTGTTSLNLTDVAGWGATVASGAVVSPETALRVSTVWACVRLISDCVGMLPLIVYERLTNGDRERATSHPLYDILHDQPNYRQTAFQFKKMLTAHLLLRGNGYARIVAGPRGFADQLIPLHPDRVTPQATQDGRMRYIYQPEAGPQVVYSDDDIFHLRGLSLDGVSGIGVIEYARETIGVSLAREQYGARFFANDSTPGGLLKTAGKLSPEGAKRVGESWRQAHSGYRAAHKVAVLEEGLEYQAIGVTNKDSQFIELGEATAEQIAGQWFGVPPHMIGLTSKATSWGSGIEEMSQGFVTFTMMPWMTEWEQSISRDLILATQKYFAEFLPDALLKGRVLDRYNAYQIARNIGLMNPNEMRRRENLNRRTDPGGDTYMATPAGAPAQPPPDDTPDSDESAAPSGKDQIMAEAAKAEMAGQLIRAGYKHKDVLKAVGLPDMEDWGAPPVTLQSQAALKEPPKSAGANSHYERLLTETAGRVARKEHAALTKAAKRGGDWAAAVAEFYADHGGYVALALAVPSAPAWAYAAAQAQAAYEGGPAVLTPDFEERAVAHLLALAQEATHA